MNDPKFSVLIPTRDRSDTLASTIGSCVAQPHDNLEIIVSDNHSIDDTEQVVRSFADPRVRYVRPPRPLSMTSNFEFLLSHVDSGYVLHLGSDDMLLPDAVARVHRIIADTGTKAVTSRAAIYVWPNFQGERLRNRLQFSTRSGEQIRSTRKMIEELVAFRRRFCELPGTYSSFVDHSVLKQAYDQGRYFYAVAPDAYSAVINCAYMDDYVYSEAPFILGGLSSRSNGASFMLHSDPKQGEAFEAENDLTFHDDIAYCMNSEEFVIADAFLQARDHAPALRAYSLDIERMCDLALRDCNEIHYERVRDAVNETRRRHGIPGEAPPIRSGALRRKARIARLRRAVNLLREGVRVVDASDFGVEDGIGAARLAHMLARFDQHRYGNRLLKMLRWA